MADCLFPCCRLIGCWRGNCIRHYHLYAQQVYRGKITWEQLEREGKVKESKRKNKLLLGRTGNEEKVN